MSENMTNLLRHFRVVWPVARRELLATLTTKGFWSTVAPLSLGLAFTLYGLLFMISLSQKYGDEIETPRDLLSSLGTLQTLDSAWYETSMYFWGDPVPYYILDLTVQNYDEAIREEILGIHYDAYVKLVKGIYTHGHGRPASREEFDKDPDKYYSIDPPYTHATPYRKFREKTEPDLTREELDEYLESGQILGYFVIPKDFTHSNEDPIFVRPKSATQATIDKLDELELLIEQLFTKALRKSNLPVRFTDTDEPSINLFQPLQVNIERIIPSAQAATGGDQVSQIDRGHIPNWLKFVTIPFVYFFVMTLGSAQNSVCTSTIEEKSSKAAEMLVSRVSPACIMDGKLFGNGLIVAVSIGVFTFFVGPPLVLMLQALLSANDFLTVVLKIANWLLFLLLGYTFYGYIQGALGSLCSDMKDIMLVLYPLQLILMFGVLPGMIFVMFEPNGTLAQTLSFIPFFTPYVMVGRTAALPDGLTYLAIVLIMLVSIYLVRKLALKLYAHGLVADRVPKGYSRIFRILHQHG